MLAPFHHPAVMILFCLAFSVTFQAERHMIIGCSTVLALQVLLSFMLVAIQAGIKQCPISSSSSFSLLKTTGTNFHA